MKYILIDDFNDTLNIVCKDDGSGEPLIYDSLKEAKVDLKEQCQNGIIVPLTNIVELLTKSYKLISKFKDYTMFEVNKPKEIDVDDLEVELGNLLSN